MSASNEKKCRYLADWVANDSAYRMRFNAVFDVENRKWVDLEVEIARWDNVYEVDRWYFSGRGWYYLRPGGHYVVCEEWLWKWSENEGSMFKIKCSEMRVDDGCVYVWGSGASVRFTFLPAAYFKERDLTILIDLHEASPWYNPRPKLPNRVYSEEEVKAFLDWVRSGEISRICWHKKDYFVEDPEKKFVFYKCPDSVTDP